MTRTLTHYPYTITFHTWRLQVPLMKPLIMLETINYDNVRGYIVSEIQEEIKPSIVQKLKPLPENSESLKKVQKKLIPVNSKF